MESAEILVIDKAPSHSNESEWGHKSVFSTTNYHPTVSSYGPRGISNIEAKL
jgi:hypothetical protein